MKFNLSLYKNWYRIQYTNHRQRYGWSLGTQVESEALAILADAKRDWADGKFDFTHERYRLKNKPQATPPPPKKVSPVGLGEKLGEFIAFKAETLAPQSMKDYRRLQSLWSRNPHKVGTQQWISFFSEGESGSKMSRLLNAFLRWAGKQELLMSNFPKSSKRTPKGEDSINPFTEQEVERIILWMDTYTLCYGRLVKFLFATGCRPGEALALNCGDLAGDYLTFSRVLQEDGEIKQGLKTQASRRIPINDTIRNCQRPLGCSAEPLFTGINGSRLNWNYFSQKTWRKCLKELGIKYRNPYQCRHTAITRWINQGVSSDIIAKWVGNSPAMIHKHYLGQVIVEMPELPGSITRQ